MADCFFYSAVLALLHPERYELRRGPPLEPWDTAHFFCLDLETGKVVDPTRPNDPAKGPGSPVDALANLEAVLDHPKMATLSEATQGRLRGLAHGHPRAPGGQPPIQVRGSTSGSGAD